jgi:hypothetical protein
VDHLPRCSIPSRSTLLARIGYPDDAAATAGAVLVGLDLIDAIATLGVDLDPGALTEGWRECVTLDRLYHAVAMAEVDRALPW